MKEIRGLIFNIQRYSIHDGSGIRTNIFLKGCPLRCQWCSNPESQSFQPEIAINEQSCINCGMCEKACPTGALQSKNWSQSACTLCLSCVDICPTGAIELLGTYMTPAEVKAEILKDSNFYRTSQGGVTFTGGEALSQWEFCEALGKSLKHDYIHTAIETSGFAKWEHARRVLQHMDEILYDIKHMDSHKHQELAGVGNELILENAAKAAQLSDYFIIRVPVIGGHNNDRENILQTGQFASSIKAKEVHLLPYHRFGENKYKKLGRDYICDAYTPDEQEMAELKAIVEGCGVPCQIGG